MSDWLRGKRGGLIVFLLIAGLVLGGLGWVTAAVLRLESEQRRDRAEAELLTRLRSVLWQLDSFLQADLGLENARPYFHYTSPPREEGQAATADVKPAEWVVLHFEVDGRGWKSAEVPAPAPTTRQARPKRRSPEAKRLEAILARLQGHWKVGELLALARQHDTHASRRSEEPGVPTQAAAPNQQANDNDYQKRSALNYKTQLSQQGFNSAVGEHDAVQVSPRLVPVWLNRPGEQETLVLLRQVRVGSREACQGVVIDWPRLQQVLAGQVGDEFPGARFLAVRDGTRPQPERTLTALPIELAPNPAALAPAGWTPLRIGLAIAWAAVLLALSGVALGGWSLLDLSERRSRFVSAVTHELRTPLTTLRLYLDMLTSGLVHEEKQRAEYLHTLHGETERLNRLIANVLDFARLEKQLPRLEKQPVPAAELLDQLRAAWHVRCLDTGKELVMENSLGAETRLLTDGRLVQQILGNLIDNACKYSRGAADPHLWVRARQEGERVVFEVEDRGPGVPATERRAIFRPFHRGREADVTAGGVGLGLALAQRWARLLGGKLWLRPGAAQSGACFRLELPSGSGEPRA